MGSNGGQDASSNRNSRHERERNTLSFPTKGISSSPDQRAIPPSPFQTHSQRSRTSDTDPTTVGYAFTSHPWQGSKSVRRDIQVSEKSPTQPHLYSRCCSDFVLCPAHQRVIANLIAYCAHPDAMSSDDSDEVEHEMPTALARARPTRACPSRYIGIWFVTWQVAF